MDEAPRVNRKDDPPPVVLTVDVEDYFMSPESIRPEQWSAFPPRIREGMGATLDLLGRHKAKATFFFLGWVAERFPDLVAETAQRGHEIGTHLYDHTFVHGQSTDQFQISLLRSLDALQRAGASRVISHRAPGFSLSPKSLRPFEILAEAGIEIDSSINPHKTYLYGCPSAPRFPWRIGRIVEWPPATISIFRRSFPVGGGGTLRILPEWYCRWARRRYVTEGWPPVIYFHPWELDPDPPSLSLPLRQSVVHHIGLKGAARKIEHLVEQHRTFPLAQAVQLWATRLPDHGTSPFNSKC